MHPGVGRGIPNKSGNIREVSDFQKFVVFAVCPCSLLLLLVIVLSVGQTEVQQDAIVP